MPGDTLLLAKQWRGQGECPAEVTLVGHTERVVQSFGRIFGSQTKPTRLSREWLRFFRLPGSAFQSFCANGILACHMHDIGKANTGFQGAVRGKSVGAQVIRHEHLSGIILATMEVHMKTLRELDVKDSWPADRPGYTIV